MITFIPNFCRGRKLVFPLTLVVFFAFATQRVEGQCGNAVFFEGFETGTIAPTWTSVATTTAVTWTVNSVLPHSGNFKFQMSGVTPHFGGVVAGFAASTPTYVSWSIYPQYAAGGTNYFVLGDAAVTYSHCLVFCAFISNTSTQGDIRFFTNSTFTNYPAAPQQWYVIELKNINYTAQTSDIWINNTLFTAGFPFRSTGLNNVSRVHLYNLSAVGTSVWDDIKIGDGLFASISPGTPNCYGGSNGSSTITPVGGMAPYTYSWSTSATTSVVSNLLANTVYTAQVTDANSCVATKTIMLSQPSSLTVSFSTQSVSCFGGNNGQAMVSAGGGTSPYTYTWSALNATSQVVGLLAAGAYTVNVSDANGCPASFTVGIAGPSASVGALSTTTHVSCFGGSNGSAYVQGTGGSGAYTYSWVNVGGTGQQKQSLAAGTYTCLINDQNNCPHTVTVTITEPPALLGQLTSTNITCLLQGAAQATASGGTPPLNYSWLPWGGSNAPANYSLVAGSQSLVITDSKGCSHTVTFSIAHNTVAPTVTIASASQTICAGQSVVLTASGNGDTFLWGNGSTVPVITVTPVSSTQYSVEVTSNANGCRGSAVIHQVVSPCTGTDEYFADRHFVVHPNPASNGVHILSELPGTYKVYACPGQAIAEGLINSGTTWVGLSELPAGIYLLNVRCGTRSSFQRIVKQ